MTADQRFCELAGIKPRIRRAYYNGPELLAYPDFSDNIAVLKVMRKRDDWDLFLPNIGHCKRWKEKDTIYAHDLIRIDYLLTTGAMRDEAIEWMEGQNEQ